MAGVSLSTLQTIFRVAPSNQMYDCWRVGAEHLPALAPYLPVPVDLGRFSCFV